MAVSMTGHGSLCIRSWAAMDAIMDASTMIGLAVCMIGHDRSWAIMHAVMNGQVMDVSTMIHHGRTHDRSWAVMHTVMVGHAHGHGRPCTRSWTHP